MSQPKIPAPDVDSSPVPKDSQQVHPRDPVIRRARGSSFSGPVVVLLVATFAFVLRGAFGMLRTAAPQYVHTAQTAHQAAAPTGPSQWLPVALVLTSATILIGMGIAGLLHRTAPRAASAPKHPANRNQPNALGIEPFLGTRSERRHTAMEAIRLDRDARTSAVARAAASERLIRPTPPASLLDSVPTLPAHHPVRPANRYVGLPPAAAAALRNEVAAGPRVRTTPVMQEPVPARS